MQGNLIGSLFLGGVSLPQLGLLADQDFNDNVSLFIDQYYFVKNNHKTVSLVVPDQSVMISKVLTWLIIIIEIVLSVALLILKPVKKYYSLIVFLIATAVFRNEFGFFCTLILISCFDTRIQKLKVQQLLKAIFFIFSFIYFFTKQSYF
jgi:hypothetical protein